MCSRYNCNSTCNAFEHVLYQFELDGFYLPPLVTENNETSTADYYITVKAVLGSGATVEVSSDGFYIDQTAPIMDPEVAQEMYIDVWQGEFTPVKYQASNDTIKAFWRCSDEESSVVENWWAIGTVPGGQDLQEFQSTGTNQTAWNSSFEGILEHNTTYYVSLICENGAGLFTYYNDTKGVTVLLFPPVDDVNVDLPGTAPLSADPIVPPDAVGSLDHTKIGIDFTLSKDESVTRYDLCMGTEDNCAKDDIFPCTWVAYNVSGTIMIEGGWLVVNGTKIRRLSEFNPFDQGLSQDQMDNSSNNVFSMEPGRTVFMCMRLCNDAMLCTNKTLGSVLFLDANTDLETSVNGSAIIYSPATGGAGRKKRAVGDNLVIETPSNLTTGHSVTFTELSPSELTASYESAASPDFVPYIVDPATTTDLVDRLLHRRFYGSDYAFSFVSVGHIMMPGPILMTYHDVAGPGPHDTGNRTIITHWNPVRQVWEMSSETCINETDTEVFHPDGSVTIKVCNTWRDATEGAVNDPYFRTETLFSLSNVAAAIFNSEPRLTVPDVVYMPEDAGTLQYQLKATDDEGDTIEFYLDTNNTDFSMGTPILSKDGMFLYTPCTDCVGVISFPIILTEIQSDPLITPKTVTVYLTINITDNIDPPVVFLSLWGDSILPPDPTEPVVVYLEQKHEWNDHVWSDQWHALLGAYDVETGDVPTINIDYPMGGDLIVYDNTTVTPTIIDLCPNMSARTNDLMFMCGEHFNLLKPASEHEWKYMKIRYEQNYTFHGVDTAKIYFSDKSNSFSRLVTIEFTILEFPCRNGGTCAQKNSSAYPCQHHRRATENFDINYNCVCSSGWTGIHCETNFDECASSPCPDPFVCFDYVDYYQCGCPEDNPNCELRPWMIVLIILGVLTVVVIVLALVYRWKRRESHIPWVEKYLFCQGDDSSHSFGSSASLGEFMDDDDSLGEKNPAFVPEPKEAVKPLPPREEFKFDRRPMTSTFDPLIGMSGPKIAPHPNEVVEPNLSKDLDTMSRRSGISMRSNKVGNSTPRGSGSPSGSGSDPSTEDTSLGSPFRVDDSHA